jgi:hypothetical protein
VAALHDLTTHHSWNSRRQYLHSFKLVTIPESQDVTENAEQER